MSMTPDTQTDGARPTPRPWRLGKYVSANTSIFSVEPHLAIATFREGKHPFGENIANAAFVVHVVNAHDDLVKALKDARRRLKGAGVLGGADDPIEVALAKAEAKS